MRGGLESAVHSNPLTYGQWEANRRRAEARAARENSGGQVSLRTAPLPVRRTHEKGT